MMHQKRGERKEPPEGKAPYLADFPIGSIQYGVASKQLQIRTRTTLFNNTIQFIRFSRVFSFARSDHIDLAATRGKRAQLPTRSKEDNLCHISEIKPCPLSIRLPILAYLLPHQIPPIGKSPLLHDSQPFRQQRIWNPQIEM